MKARDRPRLGSDLGPGGRHPICLLAELWKVSRKRGQRLTAVRKKPTRGSLLPIVTEKQILAGLKCAEQFRDMAKHPSLKGIARDRMVLKDVARRTRHWRRTYRLSGDRQLVEKHG